MQLQTGAINFPRSENQRRCSGKKVETNFEMNGEAEGMRYAQMRLSSHSARRQRNSRSSPDRTGTLQNPETGRTWLTSTPIHFPPDRRHRMRFGPQDGRPRALDSIDKNQS